MSESNAYEQSVATLASFFVGESSMQETLQKVVDLADRGIEQADMNGITKMVNDRPATTCYSDPDTLKVDQSQYDADAGPCLESFRIGEVVRVKSVDDEKRWPNFAETAKQFGVHSSLSLPLLAAGRKLGALNLYSCTKEAFDPQTEEAASRFAQQASIVLGNAQVYWEATDYSAGLAEAMKSRAVIEQAKGVLMAQSTIDEEAAFDILRRASQRENRKLRDIATDVVTKASGQPPSRHG